MKEIQQKWIKEFEDYMNDPAGMIKEVQNEAQFIEGNVDDDSTGIALAKHFPRRISTRIDELMAHSNNQ